MNLDFHYYGTYLAAYLAGYKKEECEKIGYAAGFVDFCSASLLESIQAPVLAATTQLPMEMVGQKTDILSLQKVTRIWASFHFLPAKLYEKEIRGSKEYRQKYQLICDVNSNLLPACIELAKGKGNAAAGIAMHVLADSWAHRYFAGTPSLVINNTNFQFYELLEENGKEIERPVVFKHNPAAKDHPEEGRYINSVFQIKENHIMNLGHGRAGHLPDYSFAHYKYLPAWANYEEKVKDNQTEFYYAFCQMIYALKYLRTGEGSFQTECYDFEAAKHLEKEIKLFFQKRQLDDSKDWISLIEKESGSVPEKFQTDRYQKEYLKAEKKEESFLGQFIEAALRQKSMVTNKIFKAGNKKAGKSVDYNLSIVEKAESIREFLTVKKKR